MAGLEVHLLVVVLLEDSLELIFGESLKSLRFTHSGNNFWWGCHLCPLREPALGKRVWKSSITIGQH